MKIIIAFLILSLTASAETLTERVSALQAQGIGSALEIRVHLCKPGPDSVTTNTVTTVNPDYEEESFWAGEIVTWANLASGTTTQTVHTAAGIDLKDSTLRLRALAKTSAANRDKTIYAIDGYRAARDWLVQTGKPWPVPASFAEPVITTTEILATPSPSWWQQQGLTEPPSIEDIIKEMK